MPSEQKQYLGDGVYIYWQGRDVVLTTENGAFTTNTIVLEPEVMVRLIALAKGEMKNAEE